MVFLQLLLPFIVLSTHLDVTVSYEIPLAPNFPHESYSQDGDLILGGLYSARDRSNDINNQCSGQVTSFRLQQHIEAIAFVVNHINHNSSLLPNIKLGYHILDDCRRGATALAKATRFLISRNIDCPKELRNNGHAVYNIIGITGPTSSSRTIPVSQLMGVYQIPIISPQATSDDLSDSIDHAYFLRVLPPDRLQANAMISLIAHFNWSYISMVYTDSSYGANLAKHVENAASDQSICIGYKHGFPERVLSAHNVDSVVANLIQNVEAKVIILILSTDQGRHFFSSIKKAKIVDKFIWIGSETFDERVFGEYKAESLGAFSLSFTLGRNEQFADHFAQISPWTSPGNPWLPQLWENVFDCSWLNTTQSNQSSHMLHCSLFSNISMADGYYLSDWTSKTMDSVYTLIMALDRLVKEQCHMYVHNKTLLQCCIKGPMFLDYLKKISFMGLSGPVAFDDVGDPLSNYLILQVVESESNNEIVQKKVGIWEQITNDVRFYETINWYMEGAVDGAGVPESVCSKPCQVAQMKVQLELPCCWECITCRVNEYVDSNSTYCVACPSLQWPDSETRTFCEFILPTYLRWVDIYGVVLTILGSFGIISLLVVNKIILIHGDKKIVKSSSPNLMAFISIGLYISMITAILFIFQPHTVVCSFRHILFHLSCTIIYAPLCVKTTRILRIFRASKKFQKPNTMVTDCALMGLAGSICFFQVRYY